jgi:hypothetical protein
MTWRRATGLAALVIYIPFLLMAVYTLFFISCDHCKKAAWMLLPTGPGMIPLEILRRWLNFSHLPEAIWFTLAFLISAALVLLFAWPIRLGKWPRYTTLIIAFALSSIAAFGLYSAIRS